MEESEIEARLRSVNEVKNGSNQENVASFRFFLCFLLVVWGEICTFAVIL